MPHTTRDHLEIILHESTVLDLREYGDVIVLNLDGAVLSPEHADNLSGMFLNLSSVELRLREVLSSEVQLWSDEKKAFEAVSRRLPSGLREIYEPERPIIEPDGMLLWIINGFDTLSHRWLEWRVRFKEFRLSWENQKKIRPNQAVEPTIMPVTDCAPSSTLRASHDRGSL